MSANHTRSARSYGPWAVVTGASEGIGRAFACQLAQAGVNIVLVARRAALLEELRAELSGSCGIEIEVLALDLSSPEAVEQVAARTAERDVGLLVAAAGFGTSGAFIDSPLEDERNMLAVNCSAVLGLAHVFARRFRERGHGGIVLMSSLVAFQGVPRAAHYGATKAYVQSLAEALRVELRPFGVDVIASAPGPVTSGFARRADMRMTLAETPEVVARGTLRALGRRGTVRPGLLSKLLEWSLALLPRWGRVLMIARVMSGMTRHQAAKSPSA